ncbi:hypothetical protein ACFW9D_05790 [Streptomyces sp. NPDC059524]|uniref:hypothetical protein n=1 Tax=Streptomyces sp. NPDC059524 TaxID=3346856 RepID=UPI0036ACB04F
MTHAQIPHITLPTATHYGQLPTTIQDAYDLHIEAADNTRNKDAFEAALARAAHAIGIYAPAGHVIALCDCFNQGCGCDLIFDATLPGVRVTDPDTGGNLDRLQCPTCAHDCA